MMQTRDQLGQFTAGANSAPELGLAPSDADIEGLRATLVDFLDGSLAGFGMNVGDVEPHVDALVTSLVGAHRQMLRA